MMYLKNGKQFLKTLLPAVVMLNCGPSSPEEKEPTATKQETSLKEKEANILETNTTKTLQNEELPAKEKKTANTQLLTMVFEEYSEGDFPHLLFTDTSTGEEYDFRFLNENRLNGVPILIEDRDASFGLKANPKYLKKSFLVETTKKPVLDSDLEGSVITANEWVITSIKLK